MIIRSGELFVEAVVIIRFGELFMVASEVFEDSSCLVLMAEHT